MIAELRGTGHRYVALARAGQVAGLERAPRVTRILVENVLRAASVKHTERVRAERAAAISDAVSVAERLVLAAAGSGSVEMDFWPTRLLLQDHSGVPVLADLAAVRSLVASAGSDPAAVQAVVPVDLVIDHSVEAFATASPAALEINITREYALNQERYRFLRWAQDAVAGLRIVPPGHGIVHQIHLESLASVVMADADGLIAPDTVLGTDSHTPMINAIGVLGWGVGGIEASAVMLGAPVSLLSQPVAAVELVGSLPAGIMGTDLALAMTQFLRSVGVVGSMVEFLGPGLASISVPDRATVANMAPEYGCTTAFFPVDEKVLAYLRATGRGSDHVSLVEAYTRAQGLFDSGAERDLGGYAKVLTFDLRNVEPSAAGPKRPQDRLAIAGVPASFRAARAAAQPARPVPVTDGPGDGAIAIAAITSCTNTANPRSMIAAGLLARAARARGLSVPSWVKTSLAPGSRAVTGYLAAAHLLEPLAELGFDVVGYGCTTCIGNSGPIKPGLAELVDHGLYASAVLSGNRNFEGRVHPAVPAAYLMSPAMVVAYAIAGSVLVDVTTEPLGRDPDGADVFLHDLWPAEDELAAVESGARFGPAAAERDRPDERWCAIPAPNGPLYDWPAGSSYLMPSPLVAAEAQGWLGDITSARVLVFAPDSTTTDHISPAGSIDQASVAGRYLINLGVPVSEFNSFGCRRGNHEVLVRGTFGNPRFRNRLASSTPGGWTRLAADREPISIHEAAVHYAETGIVPIVVAGRDYGMGSSRDWAAKGPRLLGVRAVLAVSFERIHRSNLVGVGILPLEFLDGDDPDTLGLTGLETFDLTGLAALGVRGQVSVTATRTDGTAIAWRMLARVDTARELELVRRGGFLADITAHWVGAATNNGVPHDA